MKLLFLCVANSARSQLAEGLARKILGPSYDIQSAGSVPSGTVNPFAIQVLKEQGIDISAYTSKAVEQLPKEFVTEVDYVITLCAEEVCPIFISRAKRLHWGLPDPAAVDGTPDHRLAAFRQTRDAIAGKLETLKTL